MSENEKKRTGKIRKLIFICSLSAIVLVVSTYAWFIGTQTVNVSSFEIEIAAADSLLLSLNGSAWSSVINISQETLDESSYEGHKNSWGGAKGIFPISTIGELDESVSRLKLYEKASFTPTTGGYRLLASRIDNYGAGKDEQDGYVVFDLFIKNTSGAQYIDTLNELDEEAIFLTTGSSVIISNTGGISNTGIENSARVAFAQIGRVNGTTTDASKITGITCEGGGDVTGICRTAQIWEPNDKNHVENAISWYDTSCLLRTGENVTHVSSYTRDSHCGTVVPNKAYETYAVRDAIDAADNIDIYDGRDYNAYTTTTTVGSCNGGTTPVTESKCLSSYGSWEQVPKMACSGTTEAYCTAVNGTWSDGACTGGNVPTTETACETAHGTWAQVQGCFAPETMTQAYCEATSGTWAEGACTGSVLPTTQNACTTAGGTWKGQTVLGCTGDNKAYCKAINGTHTETRALLESYPYFTDTMKGLTSVDRPEFMTLAPNSITKVRVYVYIEGQDIDNYDFASVGKKIAVNFGFTKERFTEEDIGYTQPEIPTVVYAAVTFDTDGGSTIAPITVKVGQKLPTITPPTKQGFVFDKWVKAGTNPEETFDPTQTNITENLKLKAVYTPEVYTPGE